ncbi:hypothetical protein BB987_16595 [Photorhabdus temperata]|nr:hypothetical protein [Photorhabdus khanii]OHV51666.1 hypothetical protein BB987_16595 [Photorhabdus temperata]
MAARRTRQIRWLDAQHNVAPASSKKITGVIHLLMKDTRNQNIGIPDSIENRVTVKPDQQCLSGFHL